MVKVIWHVTMSLDGFIAGTGDSVGALLEGFTEPSALADEIIRTTGAFTAGGRVFRADEVGQRGTACASTTAPGSGALNWSA